MTLIEGLIIGMVLGFCISGLVVMLKDISMKK